MSNPLAYEDVLPLSWTVLPAAPDAATLRRLNEAGEAALRMLTALEEQPHELGEDDSAVVHELQRLDAKLNLALEMLAELLARNSAQTDRRWMRLTAAGIEWGCPVSPEPHSLVMLRIVLSPRLPRPLELLARVEGVSADGDARRVAARFEGLSEPLADGLERLIFIHHRRAVAHTRRPDADR